MRPATTFALCLLAATGGGIAARILTPSAADPAPARTLAMEAAEIAAAATLPAKAAAATPSAAPGAVVAPIPSLAPMLQNVTPAVVNIYTSSTRVPRTRVAEFYCARIP